jgi:hypothetical protein
LISISVNHELLGGGRVLQHRVMLMIIDARRAVANLERTQFTGISGVTCQL